MFQPGIGHCSTRYSRPRSLAALSSGTKLLLEVLEVLVHVEGDVAADEPAHRLHPEGDGGVHELDHPVVFRSGAASRRRPACCRSSRCPRSSCSAALRADSMRRTRLASSGFSTFRWSATGSSIASGGTSASSSGRAEEIWSRCTPRSCRELDPVLDGEVRDPVLRLSRGVSSCSAAVRTLICMYSGLNSCSYLSVVLMTVNRGATSTAATRGPSHRVVSTALACFRR